MANRTTNIIGRVLRNLKRHGILNGDVTDEEILDELNQGQNQIMSEANPDKEITIVIQTGVHVYPLSSDTGLNPQNKNIASIKIVKLPVSWKYTFEVISNKEFVEKINENKFTSLQQPCIGTVIDNQLKVFPIPTIVNNGDELEFYVYLSSSTIKIDKNTEPELSEMWDKALEQFATSQFLSGAERQQWVNEFEKEVRRLRPVQHRKHHNLQRTSVW